MFRWVVAALAAVASVVFLHPVAAADTYGTEYDRTYCDDQAWPGDLRGITRTEWAARAGDGQALKLVATGYHWGQARPGGLRDRHFNVYLCFKRGETEPWYTYRNFHLHAYWGGLLGRQRCFHVWESVAGERTWYCDYWGRPTSASTEIKAWISSHIEALTAWRPPLAQ